MQCPPDAPHFCGKKTLARGLCVTDKSDCNTRVAGLRPVPIVPKNAAGARYGYGDEFLGNSCYVPPTALDFDYDIRFPDGEPIPESFSFLTYNIWGLAKSEHHKALFKYRKELLTSTILEANADICFLQEMSEFAYHELAEPLISKYAFGSEVPYPAPGTRPLGKEGRNRSVDVYCLSRYKPSRIRMVGIQGVLDYKNSFMIVEFPNLVVFNLYNQAGSRLSPGQEDKWLHYSRCRYDILETIHDIMVAEYPDRNIILCGDFNFDLDGSRSDWPEVAMLRKIKRMGFIDTFRSRNPRDPGFTEDTDLNFMRWNQKLIEKKLRFDAVIARGPWFVRDSRMIGTEMALLDAAGSAMFLEHMSDYKRVVGKQLKGVVDGLIPINPSDHFGVLTKFGPSSPSASPSSPSHRSPSHRSPSNRPMTGGGTRKQRRGYMRKTRRNA